MRRRSGCASARIGPGVVQVDGAFGASAARRRVRAAREWTCPHANSARLLAQHSCAILPLSAGTYDRRGSRGRARGRLPSADGRERRERCARQARDDRQGLPRDLELLVRGHDEHGDASRHPSRCAAGRSRRSRVALGIELDAEALEPRERPRAHDRRVLADARGEHDRVDAAELRGVRADVRADAVRVDLERERRRARRPPPPPRRRRACRRVRRARGCRCAC